MSCPENVVHSPIPGFEKGLTAPGIADTPPMLSVGRKCLTQGFPSYGLREKVQSLSRINAKLLNDSSDKGRHVATVYMDRAPLVSCRIVVATTACSLARQHQATRYAQMRMLYSNETRHLEYARCPPTLKRGAYHVGSQWDSWMVIEW